MKNNYQRLMGRRGPKHVICFMLAMILLMGLSAGVMATEIDMANSEQILARYQQTHSISTTLTFSGATAYCSGKVVGLSGTTHITGTAYLKEVQSDGLLKTVATWNGLYVSGDTLRLAETKAITSGKTYVLELYATVYRNNSSENVSCVSRNTAP